VDILDFAATTSGVSGREALGETARDLEAMAADFIVVRHSSAGVPHLLGRLCRSSVINAGDGMHEHPTLALRDALTIREHKRRMQGLKIAIIGDIAHSRGARSGTLLFHKLQAEVCVCGPPTMLPWDYQKLGAKITCHIREALEDADVVMVLHVQHERQSEAFVPSTREYFNLYGLTRERMRLAKPDAIVIHPGPMNSGLEIEPEVVEGPYSVILDQAANGVAARMAVLCLLSGSAGLKSEKGPH
jgi:aspartate carbamoyltransferase catalytic subunit